MILVYTHENAALVGLVRTVLEEEGIHLFVNNEFSASGMAPPYNINQEIWVEAQDVVKAQQIIEGLLDEGEGSKESD